MGKADATLGGRRNEEAPQGRPGARRVIGVVGPEPTATVPTAVAAAGARLATRASARATARAVATGAGGAADEGAKATVGPDGAMANTGRDGDAGQGGQEALTEGLPCRTTHLPFADTEVVGGAEARRGTGEAAVPARAVRDTVRIMTDALAIASVRCGHLQARVAT